MRIVSKIRSFTIFYVLIILFIHGAAFSEQKNKIEIRDLPEAKALLNDVNEAIQTKNFNILKQYAKKYKTIDWISCGTTHEEPFKYSIPSMIKILSEHSKDTQIYVNDDPEIVTLGGEKNEVSSIIIETEGWVSEYPYFGFAFQYNNKSKNCWEWVEVCYSPGPLLKISGEGKYEQVYKRTPTLPRPGPRVFKNYSTLHVRFKEIVKFMVFDALKPYAIKQKLIFTECSREIVESAQLKGMEVSSEQVIAFLKKNVGESKETKPAKGGFSTYLDTEGWKGEYPYVSFWFTETKKGWEWAGVSYCKTSLMKVQFPEEPRFK